MRTIIILALIAWGAICAGAWHLADKRIAICNFEHMCVIRATAVRDDVLIWGPAVALVALLVLAAIGLRPALKSPPASRAGQIKPNPKLPS